MYRAYLDDMFSFLQSVSQMREMAAKQAPGFDAAKPTMVDYFRRLLTFATELELQSTPARIEFAIEDAESITQQSIVGILQDIERHIRRDVKNVALEIVPVAKRGFYSDAFCSDLKDRFPKAAAELREGGICFALGRNAAAIFHAVRAGEYGVRALARAAGVRGQIDFKEWGKVLKSIEEKVAGCDKWRTGLSKSNALEFYRDGLTDARGLKDAARNIWLHLREDRIATEQDAFKALMRARDLIQRCQTRVAETNRRALSKRSFASSA